MEQVKVNPYLTMHFLVRYLRKVNIYNEYVKTFCETHWCGIDDWKYVLYINLATQLPVISRNRKMDFIRDGVLSPHEILNFHTISFSWIENRYLKKGDSWSAIFHKLKKIEGPPYAQLSSLKVSEDFLDKKNVKKFRSSKNCQYLCKKFR